MTGAAGGPCSTQAEWVGGRGQASGPRRAVARAACHPPLRRRAPNHRLPVGAIANEVDCVDTACFGQLDHQLQHRWDGASRSEMGGPRQGASSNTSCSAGARGRETCGLQCKQRAPLLLRKQQPLRQQQQQQQYQQRRRQRRRRRHRTAWRRRRGTRTLPTALVAPFCTTVSPSDRCTNSSRRRTAVGGLRSQVRKEEEASGGGGGVAAKCVARPLAQPTAGRKPALLPCPLARNTSSTSRAGRQPGSPLHSFTCQSFTAVPTTGSPPSLDDHRGGSADGQVFGDLVPVLLLQACVQGGGQGAMKRARRSHQEARAARCAERRARSRPAACTGHPAGRGGPPQHGKATDAVVGGSSAPGRLRGCATCPARAPAVPPGPQGPCG